MLKAIQNQLTFRLVFKQPTNSSRFRSLISPLIKLVYFSMNLHYSHTSQSILIMIYIVNNGRIPSHVANLKFRIRNLSGTTTTSPWNCPLRNGTSQLNVSDYAVSMRSIIGHFSKLINNFDTRRTRKWE